MSRMKSERGRVGESVIGAPPAARGGGVAHTRDAPHSRGSWLARQDSNLEPPDPESGALPLSHAPAAGAIVPDTRQRHPRVGWPVRVAQVGPTTAPGADLGFRR